MAKITKLRSIDTLKQKWEKPFGFSPFSDECVKSELERNAEPELNPAAPLRTVSGNQFLADYAKGLRA
jgi:hypothetical protein